MKLYATKEKINDHEYVIVDEGSPADELWRSKGYLPEDELEITEDTESEGEDAPPEDMEDAETEDVDLADLHWRQAVERVEAAQSADEVQALLEAETEGNARKSVIEAIEARLEELSE